MELDDAFPEGSTVAGESWRDTVSAAYNEMRHGEQWYPCGQSLLTTPAKCQAFGSERARVGGRMACLPEVRSRQRPLTIGEDLEE